MTVAVADALHVLVFLQPVSVCISTNMPAICHTVNKVLQHPVSNIIPMRSGIIALTAMMGGRSEGSCDRV